MPWEITREFVISYGHRVHTKLTPPEDRISAECKCKHLHGHTATVTIHLDSESPLSCSVLDWVNEFIANYVDNKFIIDSNDELFNYMISADHELVDVQVPDTEWFVGKVPNIEQYIPHTSDAEYLGSFLIVDFNPSSAMLAEWVWRIVQCKLIEQEIYVEKVTWDDGTGNSAVYVHEEPPEEPIIHEPEEIAKVDDMLSQLGERFTPPVGGFKLYTDPDDVKKK